MAVNNQKIIITKRAEHYADGTFITLPVLELQAACNVLSPTALIVWIKLAGNKNNYSDEFSPAYYIKRYGKSEKSYQRAINELIELKYLIPIGSNKYHFYLEPYIEESCCASKSETSSNIWSQLV